MSSLNKISVLVVEDSALMRILLSDIINADKSIELIGTAKNGLEGVEKAQKLRPDVIISDMIMPEYDGLYLVKRIMNDNPTPVILLSALDKNNELILDALQKGAFDFLDKPKEDITKSIKAKNYPLTDLVKVAAQSNIKNFKVKENKNSHAFNGSLNYKLIVIGASTGGPGAIENIILQLPNNLILPIIIAQHMPESFIQSFAKRLNLLTELQVKVAESGEELKPGYIYLAPGTANLELRKNPHSDGVITHFSKKQYVEFNYPSIDCIMESAAKIYGSKMIGVILTGMGKDGSEGLKKVKEKGGITIAQDEKTAVVYGMPKNAFDTGATDRLVPIDQMGGYLVSCL
ncbi:chemotaxis-specific protein-glutamate methyltransferase CheB [Marivirga sp. S37H4]|uniref:Protein-glutamate methylesterase/protein-glutamine glutaminase n=1 Tax=Marivirga aurantiaca TaxID=2802615 RepID=A0A935CDT7_9BACT|nr:chemotaxis-specific protein-glutamate methyltransferase CheB [Marivirga aurantiaca]MBK6267253.1 chemotaxis-specific protein-glutamate methyltransferase CheB [Marivirga aurantiaca]